MAGFIHHLTVLVFPMTLSTADNVRPRKRTARVNSELVLLERHSVLFSFEFGVEQTLELGQVNILSLDHLPLCFPCASASLGLSSVEILGFVPVIPSVVPSQRDTEVLDRQQRDLISRATHLESDIFQGIFQSAAFFLNTEVEAADEQTRT